MNQIGLSFGGRATGRLMAALLVLFFGGLATQATCAQSQFTRYKWRSGKVEDLSMSVEGFKWGMTEAQIQKVMGTTDDMDETLMAYSDRPVFGADGEVRSRGDIVFSFTNGKLTSVQVHYSDAELFDSSLQWLDAVLGEGTKGAGDDPENFYWYTWKSNSVKVRLSNSFDRTMDIKWVSASDPSFAED